MAAQKRKKIFSAEFFAFLNVYYPKTHLIKALNSLDSSRPYGRLLENQKNRELSRIMDNKINKFHGSALI